MLVLASTPAAPANGGNRGDGPRAHASVTAGAVANTAQWGFTVLILDGGKPECGGSVISPTRVLTAAHCALVPASRLTVVASRFRLSDTTAGQVIGVSAVHVHPDFAINGRHDLAVLELGKATSAPPIPLATAADTAAATVPWSPMRVAGWGARNPIGTRYSNVLRTTLEIARASRRCARAYRRYFAAQSMICALGRKFRHKKFNRTACVGDSGGPLIADLPVGPRLTGVVSFGGGAGFFPLCGFRKLPTVYAKVSDGLPFINQYLGS